MINVYKMSPRGLVLFGPMACENCGHRGADVMRLGSDTQHANGFPGLTLCPSCIPLLLQALRNLDEGFFTAPATSVKTSH